MAASALPADAAAVGRCVTFGIVPVRPQTGFGYLHAPGDPGVVRTVEAFVEKPDLARAEAFLASGEHYWNSGMFVFPARRYLELLAEYEPEIATAAEHAWAGAERDLDFTRLDANAFAEGAFELRRLRRDGTPRRRGHGAARCGLGRRRQLVRPRREQLERGATRCSAT